MFSKEYLTRQTAFFYLALTQTFEIRKSVSL